MNKQNLYTAQIEKLQEEKKKNFSNGFIYVQFR